MPEIYPKRLIEVDLPIRRISEHARREKSIRHGHISTLHIWWARRPLAACRAVICASLWPDPADEHCPAAFREAARGLMSAWAKNSLGRLSPESYKRFIKAQRDETFFKDNFEVRGALLDFIADFANWDNSTVPEYLETSRALTAAAHIALGGAEGTRPLVVDPFSGGASIPLEALRIGADTFASDLNPVAVLLNKVLLEYIPKYGQRLADEVRRSGEWVHEQASNELAKFYPNASDGSVPIAYLWARTIRCEGPGCGAEVPLMRSLWLSKKTGVAFKITKEGKSKPVVGLEISKVGKSAVVGSGTVRRSACTCPICGFTTPDDRVRQQFVERNGGANDARLIAVVTNESNQNEFRAPSDGDIDAFQKARRRLTELQIKNPSITPNEPLPYLRSIFNVKLLGIDTWGKLFNDRQSLALSTIAEITERAAEKSAKEVDADFAIALASCMSLAVDRCADYWSSLAVWAGDFVAHTFGRQALGIVWDYAEVNGFAHGSGSYLGAIDWIARCVERDAEAISRTGQVEQAQAQKHPLPSDSANAFITDPPYYDAVPYADLSDFFYVWLKRSLKNYHRDLFSEELTPKRGEIVQLSERNKAYAYKTREYFEELMKQAMTEGRRLLLPGGIAVVVFAHKSTQGWEAQLGAMIQAGWTITGSWPIDTERPGRLRANRSAALASSIHLVCRPRDSTHPGQDVGDWRDVLGELPIRIQHWMPRLAKEGIVGADAIFACLGPALEIFSRYSRVEKASGEQVTLKEYLEQVWASVEKEALKMIFEGADATGFEEDARLTAMWLWTMTAGATASDVPEEDGGEDEEEESEKGTKKAGFVIEYDAARKMAQGLGAHLENLTGLVEVKGDKARLLPVEDRAKRLFGKDGMEGTTKRRKKESQSDLFAVLAEEERSGIGIGVAHKPAATVLDRVHQTMLLFAAGRSEALKRFLVEEGVGRDAHFWRLSQALSALYPGSSDEKRWVDGVLARKKALGF